MKKAFLILFSFCTLLFFSSCGGDCDVVGTWKVKSAKLTSTVLDDNIIKASEKAYLNYQYTFNADGTMEINTQGADKTEGVWNLDQSAQTLSWGPPNKIDNEVNQIISCGFGSLNLKQRMPTDLSKEETTTLEWVLERVE